MRKWGGRESHDVLQKGSRWLMDNFFSCRLLRRVQQVLRAENLAVTVVLKERAKRSYSLGWRHVPIWFLFAVERLEIRTVWALRERLVT